MSAPSDIQTLLASIRPRPSPSAPSSQDAQQSQYPLQHPQRHGYHHPSVLSAIHSPSPTNNTPPHRASDILSPNVATPQPQASNSDSATNLLNLLRFSQTASPSQQQAARSDSPQPALQVAHEAASKGHDRSISASDLVATLLGGQTRPLSGVGPSARQADPAQVGETVPAAAQTTEDTQEMLLRLLNRSGRFPESSKQFVESPTVVTSHPEIAAGKDEALSGQTETKKESAVLGALGVLASKSNSQTPKESIFTYVNPFDQLAAASPRKSPHPKVDGDSPAAELAKQKEASIPAKEGQNGTSPGDAVNTERPESIIQEQKSVSAVVDELKHEIDPNINATPAPIEDRRNSDAGVEQEARPVFSVSFEKTEEVISQTHPKETIKKEAPQTFVTATNPAEEVTDADNGTADALAESWESAEESAKRVKERVVPVYNFPLKPFISITVKAHEGKLESFRDDGIMDIARLRKDFDQLDRSLTSATSEYIVYALAKNGGMRIVRQEDGSDKQIFRSTRDRIFNVTLCTSFTADGNPREQSVLGIGVSGTVYWAMISKPVQDLFEMDELESESLIFPPFPASDENTSGGQLKTRAKRSSRHPEFFAIGRGKNIYVVSPQAAMSSNYGVSKSYRTVDTEKFFKERALKISTGKAGKDFTFSDDDSVIASLDKTGRLRFWDIREAVNNPVFASPHGPIPTEIRVPLGTFITGTPIEKSWPTSVLFLDKLRPYAKSMALRYILVGLKQNHTLQLWDIGLGKAVQELKFPHENESDAICSVAYHPASGIIVVGHPTRNSIYFVHLSAPRYSLQPMSQASFVKRAVEKDSSLPRPDSTACMSGIREVSFASKGQLRSLDILPITKNSADKRGVEEDSGLFELYVMHSRGVACLNIKKEDLGWSTDNRIIRPVNSLEEGFIEAADLETYPSYLADEMSAMSTNGEMATTPQKVVAKETKKVTAMDSTTTAIPSRNLSPTKTTVKQKVVEESAEPSGTSAEKLEKKKKKKGPTIVDESPAKVKETNAAAMSSLSELWSDPLTTVGAVKSTEQPTSNFPVSTSIDIASTGNLPSAPSADVALPLGGSSDSWNKQLEELQTGVAREFTKSLGRELEGLYRRFDEERRAWDAASAAKQDQVLRLISSTLSNNIEKNLARMISNSIQADVVPALTSATSVALGKQIHESVSHHLGRTLPDAVFRSIQQSDLAKGISDMVSQKLAAHVESEFSRTLQSTTNALKNTSLRAAEKVGTDMERQLQMQMKHYEIQRHNDYAKIDQLVNLVGNLSDTISSMAAAQTSLQHEIVKLHRLLDTRPNEEMRRSTQQPSLAAARPQSVSTRSLESIELVEIAQLMQDGSYEEGTVKWLQSSQQADLFDNLFVRLNPSYLTGLSPLLILSVGVAVTTSLVTNVAERLAWLEVVLQSVNLTDPDIREFLPRTMDTFIERLESLYMAIVERNPHDPVLRKIPPLSRRARELRGSQ